MIVRDTFTTTIRPRSNSLLMSFCTPYLWAVGFPHQSKGALASKFIKRPLIHGVMIFGSNIHNARYAPSGKHEARIACEMRHGIAQYAILADPARTYNQNQSSRHSTRIPSRQTRRTTGTPLRRMI